jgi:CheY-like chemotaxis protein
MILIADDDIYYSEDLKAILEGEGYQEVRVVHTGHDAVSFVEKFPAPDAIVLDMMIPYGQSDYEGAMPPGPTAEPRGVRVARELAARGFDLSRVVVITALSYESYHDQMRQIGLKNIYTKPVETALILRTVGRICSQKRPSK